MLLMIPFYSHLRASVGRLWRPKCSMEIHSRENVFFFFKFSLKEGCDRILHEDPWLFDGRLIILKPLFEHIGLERDLLSSIPVWVRFPNLHLKLWSQSIIVRLPVLLVILFTWTRQRLKEKDFLMHVVLLKLKPLTNSLKLWNWLYQRKNS